MTTVNNQKIRIDWSANNLTVDGKVMCQNQVLKFIRGINGPRQNPVTRKQILSWVSCTPTDFVDECIDKLLDAGMIIIKHKSLSSGRKFNGSYVYTIAQ